MSKYNKIVWTFLFIAPALALIIFSILKPPVPKGKESAMRAKILHSWLAGQYVSVRDIALKDKIAQISVNSVNVTNALIVEKARSACYDFLMAFSTGNFDDYTRFRFPQPAEIIVSNFLNFKQVLSEKTNYPTLIITPPPEWAVDTNYVKTNGWPPKVRLPLQVSGPDLTLSNFTETMVGLKSFGTYYQGYIEAICPEQSFIKIVDSTELPGPLSDFIFAGKNDQMGVTDHHPYFYHFKSSPDDILNTQHVITFVTIKLMVRLRAPDTCTPFYVRFYYDPESSSLIPCELAACNLLAPSQIETWF